MVLLLWEPFPQNAESGTAGTQRRSSVGPALRITRRRVYGLRPKFRRYQTMLLKNTLHQFAKDRVAHKQGLRGEMQTVARAAEQSLRH